MEWEKLSHSARRQLVVEQQKTWKTYIHSLDKKQVTQYKTRYGRNTQIVKYNETPVSQGFQSKYVPYYSFNHFNYDFAIDKQVIDQITIPEQTNNDNIWIVGIHEENKPTYEWLPLEIIINMIENGGNQALIKQFRKWLCDMITYHIQRQELMIYLEKEYKVFHNYFIPNQSIFVMNRKYFMCRKIKPYIISQKAEWHDQRVSIIQGEMINFNSQEIEFTKHKQWMPINKIRLITNYNMNDMKYPSIYLIIKQHEMYENTKQQILRQAVTDVNKIITDIFQGIGNQIVSKYLHKPQSTKRSLSYHCPGILFAKIWNHLYCEHLLFAKFLKKSNKIHMSHKIKKTNAITGHTDYYLNKFMQFLTHNVLMTYSYTNKL